MTAIVHFTTVHPRSDIRIRVKEIASLISALGAEVRLIVQDSKGAEEEKPSDCRVVDIGPVRGGRLRRMTIGAFRMWRAVRAARPALAHFHDPELIPVGLLLKLSGIRIVYDVHEDVPRQILGKEWIAAVLRRPLAVFVASFEWVAGRAFDGFVAATPTIARRFPATRTVTVQNFPLLGELVASMPVPYRQRPLNFAYVGGISAIRGGREMVNAMSCIGEDSARLELAGAFQPPKLEDELQGESGWQRVQFHGWASRLEVARLLSGVRAGLVLFHPLSNHVDAQPNKMFEYMAAGLPVIASDFPLWRGIVEGAGCGLLVDPLDPVAIATAMQWLLDHPEEAEAMGRHGRSAVEEKYNWQPEAHKLIGLYEHLLGKGVK